MGARVVAGLVGLGLITLVMAERMGPIEDNVETAKGILSCSISGSVDACSRLTALVCVVLPNSDH